MSITNADMHVCEVTLRGNVAAGGSDAKNIANVFHYRRTSTSAPWSNTNIATAWLTAFIAKITNCLNEDYTTQSAGSRCVNDAEDNEITVADTTPGNVTGERLPNINAATLILKTAKRGPFYRGSKHFSPLSEGDSVDDVLTSGSITLFGTLKTALLAGFTDSDGNIWKPCVLSRTKSLLETNPTVVSSEDITQILLNKNVGSMRRRRVKTVR